MIKGNFTLLERGRLPSAKVPRTPRRINSRTDRPCAAACAFSFRYKGVGISTVVRTACFFTKRFSHKRHKYGTTLVSRARFSSTPSAASSQLHQALILSTKQLHPIPLHIRNANDQTLPDRSRCPGHRIKCHGNISRVEQTVQLRPARPKLLCHHLLRFLLLAHGLLQLPSHHTFDSGRLDFLPDSFFVQKTVERRPTIIRFLAFLSCVHWSFFDTERAYQIRYIKYYVILVFPVGYCFTNFRGTFGGCKKITTR